MIDPSASDPNSRNLYPKSLDQKLHLGSFIVFDIETTGGNPEKNGITEVYALRWHRGKVQDTFYSMVNPRISIPPIVRRMTGITNQMVRGAPFIEDVMPKLVEFARDAVLVSHNTIGDLKFLRYFARAVCGVDWSPFFLCTHLLSEKLLPDAPDKSLGGLVRHLGFADTDLHRAEADAFATLELFKVLQTKLYEQGLHQIIDGIRLQGDSESGLRVGWAIPQAKLRRFPRGPGVLRLTDRAGDLIYFASCKNLRTEAIQLSQLDKLPRQLMRLCLKAHDLECVKHRTLVEAMVYEAQMAKESPCKFASSQWNKRVAQIVSVEESDGTLKVHLAQASSSTVSVFGPIKDRARAQGELERLARILKVKSTRRGLKILPSHRQLVEAFFLGQLARYVARLKRSKLSLRYLLLEKFRKGIDNSIREAEKLDVLGSPCNYSSLLMVDGVITAPLNAKEDRWQLFPVIGSLAGSPFEVEGDWRLWLLSREGKRFIRNLGKRQPFDPQNFHLLNATLWLVLSNPRRLGTHRFWSAEELVRFKEGYHAGKFSGH